MTAANAPLVGLFTSIETPMNLKTIAVIGILLIPSSLVAQPSLSNELSVGLGVGFPRESDPLNVVGEEQLPTSVIGGLGYRKYVTNLLAIGFRFTGTLNNLKNYTVMVSGGNPQNIDFTLTRADLALEGLLLLSESRNMNPFVTVMVSYATGVLSSSDMGKLKYGGASFGGGLGLRFALSPSIWASVEGIGLFGSAKWKQAPFVNSSSTDFNPSSITLLTSISFDVE